MKDLALKILQEETNSFDMQSRLRDDVIDAMIRFTNECKQCNIQHVIKLACLCPRTKYDDCDKEEPDIECAGCHYFRQACL